MSDSTKTCFFDTSALVKRYHEEAGTAVVDEVFGDRSVTRFISDLTIIECHAAFAKKARMGEIDVSDFRVTMQRLRQDIEENALRVRSLGQLEKRKAVMLLRTYAIRSGLRTLDALQLAVIQSEEGIRKGVIYCADRRLNNVMETEGLKVVNPETDVS